VDSIWTKVQTSRYFDRATVFALKYEGVNLLFFKKLFDKLGQTKIVQLINAEYTGQYIRKIWFLYEWLMQEQLPIADLTFKNFVPLLDEDLQYASSTGIIHPDIAFAIIYLAQ